MIFLGIKAGGEERSNDEHCSNVAAPLPPPPPPPILIISYCAMGSIQGSYDATCHVRDRGDVVAIVLVIGVLECCDCFGRAIGNLRRGCNDGVEDNIHELSGKRKSSLLPCRLG